MLESNYDTFIVDISFDSLNVQVRILPRYSVTALYEYCSVIGTNLALGHQVFSASV